MRPISAGLQPGIGRCLLIWGRPPSHGGTNAPLPVPPPQLSTHTGCRCRQQQARLPGPGGSHCWPVCRTGCTGCTGSLRGESGCAGFRGDSAVAMPMWLLAVPLPLTHIQLMHCSALPHITTHRSSRRCQPPARGPPPCWSRLRAPRALSAAARSAGASARSWQQRQHHRRPPVAVAAAAA